MSDVNVASPVETLTFLTSIQDDINVELGEKGIFGRSESQPTLRQIPLTVLQENVAQTLDSLRKLFDIDSTRESKLPLKEVQVSFEVTASGKIALLGTSAGLEGRGAITLTFGK